MKNVMLQSFSHTKITLLCCDRDNNYHKNYKAVYINFFNSIFRHHSNQNVATYFSLTWSTDYLTK